MLPSNMTATKPLAIPDDNEDTVILNVGGIRHEVRRQVLASVPGSKLASPEALERHFRPQRGDYFFDRHPGHFQTILNYYRTGELHFPKEACASEFALDLTFWGIEERDMEECCWIRYNADTSRRTALLRFNEKSKDLLEAEKLAQEDITAWKRFTVKVWVTLEGVEYTLLAKVTVF